VYYLSISNDGGIDPNLNNMPNFLMNLGLMYARLGGGHLKYQGESEVRKYEVDIVFGLETRG
jgi:hypothetical protein